MIAVRLIAGSRNDSRSINPGTAAASAPMRPPTIV
jgi:hypothetical protein